MIRSLNNLDTKQAKTVIDRLATVNPVYLGRYFAKIKLVDYKPTPPMYVELPGRCWVWTGATDESKGTSYPKIKVAGKTRRVHRWIFSVIVRPLRIDEDAHHECENPMCVNPFHLVAVDSAKHSKRGPPSNWDGTNVVPSDADIPI